MSLSIPTTRAPSVAKRLTASEPINPADPVTIIVRTSSMVSGNFPADENLSQRDQAPFHFSINDLEPGNTRWRSLIGPRHASWIQKQNAAAFLISRHVGMTMQNNIDITRRRLWRNMLQAKSQSVARKIDNQRPLGIAVAVPARNRDRRTGRTQFIQNYFRANIAQMPNLIRVARKIDNLLRQLVMRVRENKNSNASHTSLKKAGTQEGKIISNHSCFPWKYILAVILCVLCVRH